MLSTNACPTFTFRVFMLCSNSDRSVSSYSVHWACVWCWGVGTGQNVVPAPQHPTGSWLLPLSCSSLGLLFVYCISGRVSRRVLVSGEQLALSSQSSYLLSSALLSCRTIQCCWLSSTKCSLKLHTVVWLVGRGVGRPAWGVSSQLGCVAAGSPFSPCQGIKGKGNRGPLTSSSVKKNSRSFKFSAVP